VDGVGDFHEEEEFCWRFIIFVREGSFGGRFIISSMKKGCG
jgi:predicted secreted protein